MTEIVDGHNLLARIALRMGRIAVATEEARQAMDVASASDNLLTLAEVLAVVGQLAWAFDDATRSTMLHAGAEALRSKIGFVHPVPRARELARELDELRLDLGQAAFDRAWEHGAALDLDELANCASSVLHRKPSLSH